MKEQIIKIIENYSPEVAADEILSLFAVSGSALHDKLVKQIPNEYKEQVSKTIKKHYR